MKDYQIDWTLYDQIERNREEKAAAEWQEKVNHAKRIGSLQARIEVAVVVMILLLAWILIPAPFPR